MFKTTLINAKDASNVENAYIEATYTKDTCIKSIDIKTTYARGFRIAGAFIKASYSKVTCIGDARVATADVIKCLGMYLQSFQNLEMGDTRLKIRVGTCYIKSACINSASIVKCSGINLKMRDTGLEVQIKAGCIEGTYIGSICIYSSSSRFFGYIQFQYQILFDLISKFSLTSCIWSMSQSVSSLLYFVKISFNNIVDQVQLSSSLLIQTS